MTSAGRVIDEGWRPNRSWEISDALDHVLDRLEVLYRERPELPSDPLPITTGFGPLDRVSGGGVHPGEVLVVATTLVAAAETLLLTVLRRSPHATLAEVPSVLRSAHDLLAAEAGLPAVMLRRGTLSEREWGRITRRIGALAKRGIWLGEAESLPALAHHTRRRRPRLLLVHQPERLDVAVVAVPALVRLAAQLDLAVIATTLDPTPLPRWARERTRRVELVPHRLASRAALVRADELEAIQVAQVDLDLLRGRAG